MTATITRTSLAKLTPDAAAALFIVHRDAGKPVEAGLFEEWLAQSEQNEAAWLAAEGAWTLFDDADDPAFDALRAAALAASSEPQENALQRHWRPVVAAVMLVVAGIGMLQLSGIRQDRHSPGVEIEVADRQYAGAPNGPKEFVLADGSRMTLSSAARASVSMTARQRRVVLAVGDAVFAVRHDASRPFTVQAGGHTIVDLGTRFQVALEQGATRVALYEGSVSVADAVGQVSVLKPGEQLIARPGHGDIILPIAAAGSALEDVVQFDDVTLADAAQTVSQGSPTTLIVSDPAVAELRISGRFRLRDPDRFARSAAELLLLRVVRISPTRIELRRRR